MVCPRCATDNAADEEYCRECGLELHPDPEEAPHAAGIRRGGAPAEEPWLSRYAQFIIGGIVVAAVLWIPIVNTWRQRTQFATCQENLGKIAVAFQLYLRDSDNILPVSDNWTPLLLSYLKDTKYLACPSRPAKVGYAYNSNLSGQKLILPPGADAITFFEAPGDTVNMSGTDFEWLKPPAHARGNNVALFSGAVKVLREPPEQKFWIPSGMTQPTPPPVEMPPQGEHKGEGPDTGSMPGSSLPGSSLPGSPPSGSSPNAGAGPDSAAGTLPGNPPLPPQPGGNPPPPPGGNPPLPPQPGGSPPLGTGAQPAPASP